MRFSPGTSPVRPCSSRMSSDGLVQVKAQSNALQSCHKSSQACFLPSELCWGVQVKAQSDAKSNDSSPDLPQVNFGPKYEQHVAELQARLNEATAT